MTHACLSSRALPIWAIAAVLVLPPPVHAGDKIEVSTQDDLPRHTYAIHGTVSELMGSEEQFAELLKEVRRDLESDLETYEIQDKTTLKEYHDNLMTIDLFEGEFGSALEHLDRVRELEEKTALKLTRGLGMQARIETMKEVGGMENLEKFRAAYERNYRALVQPLPWEDVQDVIEGNKGQMEMLSEALLMGLIQEQIEPIVAQAGEVSAPVAHQIIGLRSAILYAVPLKEQVIAVLQEYIDENKVEKEDIWAARSLDLTGHEDLTPVTVAIWDTGVDAAVFGEAMFRNPNEKMNGEDSDGNGHIDDVHGLAYDLHDHPTTGALYPMDEAERPVPELQAQIKGLLDMRAAIDSPEAGTLKKKMSSLEPGEVGSFLEDLTRYSIYSHGTHVAGIAVESNPAASILVCRLTADHKMRPDPPTLEDCERAAQNFRDIVAYYKANGVRVVNMSWVVARSGFEQGLEMHNIGKDAEERKKMAREMFEVMKVALREAFESAPEILFVGGAGNSDNDITFDEFFPPMFQLPNLLIAGAVDQAGEPTSFTSFGSTVNVYSNGFEVESFVPGGDRVKFSGTSMASPNVVNLAAKLIALEPELTPREVVELIREGADEVVEGDQKLKIINPRKSAELLRDRDRRASM